MNALARTLLVAAVALAPATALAQTPAPTGTQPPAGITVTKLGCFSPQRAFSESAEGKAGLARVSALQEKRAKEIDEKNQALQKQEQALQASLSTLSEEARIRRSREIEKFRIDVQRFIQDAQGEVAGAQREMENGFVAKLRPAVEKVAKDRGLLFVWNLDEPSVVWSDPSLDITAEVVQLLARAEPPKK